MNHNSIVQSHDEEFSSEYRSYSLSQIGEYDSDEQSNSGGVDADLGTYIPDIVPDQPKYNSTGKMYEHIKDVSNDNLDENDIQSYLYSIIDYQGLVDHNTIAYSEFLDRGIAEIIQRLFNIDRPFPNPRDSTDRDRKIKTIKLGMEFSEVFVHQPTHGPYRGGDTQPLFPKEARLTGVPYSAPITMNCAITLTAIDYNDQTDHATINVGTISPCNIPIMTNSSKCHLKNMTRAALKYHGEDPNEQGGIFIVGGQEYLVDSMESSRFNKTQCHAINTSELNRCDFLSQPPNERFGNSSQIKVSLMANGHIMVEINSIKFVNVKIPFDLIYRLFGMTDASEIIKTVIFDSESNNAADIKMKQIIDTAFHVPDKRFGHLRYESDRRALIDGMSKEMVKSMANRQVDEVAGAPVKQSYVNQDLLLNLDNVFLPHMGKEIESRIIKLRVLGTMIRELLLTHLKILPVADRDSLANKRMQGAGTCMPKLFKTMFNSYIITPFINAIRKEIQVSPWDQIKGNMNKIRDIFENTLHNADLTRGLEQGIRSSSKSIVSHKKELANRVSSRLLERKNFLNYVCSLRSVVSHGSSNASKQTKRADEIRRVHATMVGYICPINSADSGEKVGIVKNIALTATIIGSGNSYNLKLKLLSDPEVIALKDVKSEDISRQKLSMVYVNGEWIGCSKNGHLLVDRYRKLRRQNKAIDRFTTISWDTLTDKIEFLLDADRMMRPLLIVDSNIDEYMESVRDGNPIEFVQNIRLTKEYVDKLKSGDLTFNDIIEDGVAEYISPEEQENCWLAQSLNDLKVNRHDPTIQYTHMEIEASLLGLASHVSVLAHCTQPARSTYESNQSKQTSGLYAMNFSDRADKNKTWQYNNQIPLCRTITARYIPPNGLNLTIGYMSVGTNVEDSVAFKKSAVNRGLFACAYFKKESHELEQDEEFATPDPRITKNVKSNANYNKLIDGVVPVGTLITRGDVLIGVIVKNTRRGQSNKKTDYEYVDRSIMYKSTEDCVVSKVIDDRGPNHERFITVVLRYNRTMSSGDKCSTRSGNKCIVSILQPESDMPYLENGVTLDAILNPCSVPSRMTIGGLLESSLAQICARKGVSIDVTAFRTVTPDNIMQVMQDNGFRYNGKSRMFNGETGMWFDIAIFTGPAYLQKLQKYVLDNAYAVSRATPTDALTGQCTSGKASGGGLKIGEMELWALEAHGAEAFTYEKFSQDSDGFKMYICRTCGHHAIYNEKEHIYVCKKCNDYADIAMIETSRASVVFQQELAGSNIKMKLGMKPREFEINE